MKRIPNLTQRMIGRDGEELVVYRWNPGPALRMRGYRGFDLWSGPGAAMSIADWKSKGFSDQVVPELRTKAKGLNQPMPLRSARKAAEAINAAATERSKQRKRETSHAQTSAAEAPRVTVRSLIEAFRREKKGQVAARTFETYRVMLRPVEDWIGDEVPAIIDKALLVERFWKWKDEAGHHAAYKRIQTFCTALGWAHGRPPFVGPVMPEQATYTKLGIPKPPARLRVGLPAEMEAMLTAFDDPARLYAELETPLADRVLEPLPSMGDALMLMLWTCARVGDSLRFADQHLHHRQGEDVLIYKPEKTNHRERKVVVVPVFGPLRERLPQIRARRAALATEANELVISERTKKSYIVRSPHTGIDQHNVFTFRWNDHRALAGQIVPSLIGEGLNPLGEQWLDFKAQDCRDTAATRLYAATDGDLNAVSNYHGSDPEDLRQLMKHYIEINPFDSIETGRTYEEWARASGITV